MLMHCISGVLKNSETTKTTTTTYTATGGELSRGTIVPTQTFWRTFLKQLLLAEGKGSGNDP